MTQAGNGDVCLHLPVGLCLLLCILLLLPSLPVSAVNIYIKPNDEDCFFEELALSEKMFASYAVQAGGYMDIDVKVYGPDMKIVYEAEHSQEGTFQFKAIQAGTYKLCFINTMSVVSGKTISFNTYTGHSLMAKDAAKAEHLTPLEQAIVTASEGLFSIHDTQVYLKYREVRHQQTVESTNSRVLWWSLLELTGLVAISAFNIVFLRQAFERQAKR